MNYLGRQKNYEYYTNDTRFTGVKYCPYEHSLSKTEQGYHLHLWVSKSSTQENRLNAATKAAAKILNLTHGKKIIFSWSYDYFPNT